MNFGLIPLFYMLPVPFVSIVPPMLIINMVSFAMEAYTNSKLDHFVLKDEVYQYWMKNIMLKILNFFFILTLPLLIYTVLQEKNSMLEEVRKESIMDTYLHLKNYVGFDAYLYQNLTDEEIKKITEAE